uniref:BPTI/Kunitz inhibitor domain-containing protein n=1 Tax=Echeneis naucrates TaxID=173247 RepID=A0A665U1L6_ECHNA
MNLLSLLNFALRWFFDSGRGRCSPFWYSGCGGNDNRFMTQRECESFCGTKRLEGRPRCQLDADSGLQCADYVQAWYYDKHIGACSPFWYGGCAGNANRFNTENECFQTCGILSPDWLAERGAVKPQRCSTRLALKVNHPGNHRPFMSDCFLRQDAGGCQNYTMMWYFDTEQNECSRFWYGGCGGNENRFKTQEEFCIKKIFRLFSINVDLMSDSHKPFTII